MEKIETARALRRPSIGTSKSGQCLKQFVDRKASRGRVASAANVSLPFPPLVFFGRSPSQVLVPSYEGIDNTTTVPDEEEKQAAQGAQEDEQET